MRPPSRNPNESMRVKFPLPDAKICEGFGAIAIRAAQLDHALRLCFKDFCGITLREALEGTADDTASELRRRLKRLSRQRLGEGGPLVRFHALLTRAREASSRRNHVLHAVVVTPIELGETSEPSDED